MLNQSEPLAFHEKKARSPWPSRQSWRERLKYPPPVRLWQLATATGMVLDPDAVEASIPHVCGCVIGGWP
jgi:hypothetical protein